ncbi:hypothetical protein CsatA_025367 [Cannabis sativa]
MDCGVQVVEKMMEYSSIVAGETTMSFGVQGVEEKPQSSGKITGDSCRNDLGQNNVCDIVVFEETPIIVPGKRDRNK